MKSLLFSIMSKNIAAQIERYRWLFFRREYDKVLPLLDEMQKQFPKNSFPALARSQTFLTMRDFKRASLSLAALRQFPDTKNPASQ